MQQQDSERRVKQYFKAMRVLRPRPQKLLPIFIIGILIIFGTTFISPILSGITAIGFSLYLYYVIDKNFAKMYDEIIEIIKQLPTE